jgi:hypothetical protein
MFFESLLLYSHNNLENEGIIIHLAMYTHQGYPLNGPLVALAHFGAFCYTIPQFPFMFKSQPSMMTHI